MSGANIAYNLPLTRLNPWYPGQMGVPGGWTDTGLRQHCTGTIFYVDPNYPGASDARDGTDPTAPLLTVATAITRCQPYRGDVIVVGHNSQWYYAEGGQGIATAQYTTCIVEEVTLNVSGVRLVGLSPSALGVMWTPASNAGTCITVTGLDCIIEGFVFTEGPTYAGCDAIYSEWDGATLFGENMTVRHCVFDDTVDTAIQLEYSWYCDIHSNIFWECDAYGVYVDPTGSGAAYVTIHDNIFHSIGTSALSLAGCDDSHVYRNSLYDVNAAGGAPGANCFIDFGTAPGTTGSSNQIFHNVMSCTLGADYNTSCSPGAGSPAWIHNYLMNGVTTGNPT